MRDKDIERFWSKVDKTQTCWIWTASKFHFGHGMFWYQGKNIKAHRFSWLIHFGTIPDGLFVLHKCDTPACVNPEHLWLGTGADNIKDAARKGRMCRGEKHHSNKLTEDDVIQIREQYKTNNKTKAELSRIYGVSDTVIHHIIVKKKWRYLETPTKEHYANHTSLDQSQSGQD